MAMPMSPLRTQHLNTMPSKGFDAEAPLKAAASALSVDSLPIGAPTRNPFEERLGSAKKARAARKKRTTAADVIAGTAPAVNIEEMAVGGGSSNPMPDEYPPGFTPPENDENAVSLPLEKRLVSKKWQDRKSAYDELVAAADLAPDDVRAAHSESLHKMVADANPFAQERALELLVKLAGAIEKPEEAKALAANVMPVLCEKALSGRPNVKSRASEAALLLVEAGAALSVQAACVGMGTHKVPKVVLAALELLSLVICEFGPRVFELRGLLKPLGALGEGHKDKSVREAALICLVELRARTGEATVSPALKDAKPACVAEYERLCTERSADSGREQPPRLVNGATPIEAVANGSFATVGGGDEEEVVEIAVLGKLSKAWHTEAAAEKWSVRKGAFDALVALADTPRIKKEDYTEVLRALKAAIGKDANVNVVSSAVRAVGLLARGLGSDFGRHAKDFAPLLLEKSAEKNRVVVDAVTSALDALYAAGCAQLPEVAEWASNGLNSKTPQVRAASAEWLRRCAAAKELSPAAARGFISTVLKATDDGAADVRTAAYAAIAAALAAAPSDHKTDALLKDLDGTKKKSLERAIAAGGGSASAPAASAGAKSSAAASAAPSRAASTGSALTASTRPTTAASSRLKTLSRSASSGAGLSATMPSRSANSNDASASGSGGAKASRVTEGDLDASDSPMLSESDSAARLGDLVPGAEGLLTKLKSKAWRDRMDAVDALSAALSSPDADEGARDPALIDGVVAILTKTPGWKEPMVAVGARVAAAIGALARAAGKELDKATVAKTAIPLGEKLADAKLRAPASDALLALAEAAGAPLVGAYVCKGARAHKNPKVLLETALWLRTAALGFGPAGGAGGLARAHGVTELLAEALSNRDGKVREAAVGAAVAIVRVSSCAASAASTAKGLPNPFLKALTALLEGAVPALAAVTAALEAEANDPLPTPTHRPAGTSELVADSAPGEGEGVPGALSTRSAGAPVLLAAHAQRVSVLPLLPPGALAEMGSSAWKARLKAIAGVHDALKELGASVKVDANIGGLAEQLRARLADTNRTVAAAAAELVGALVSSIGRPVLPHAKSWAAPLFALLADARPAASDAAAAALGSVIAQISIEPLLPFAKVALSSDVGRAPLLALLATYAPAARAEACSAELKALAPAALAALAAEKGEAKANADKLVGALACALGAAAIKAAVSELKPSEATAVAAAVRRHCAASGAQAADGGVTVPVGINSDVDADANATVDSTADADADDEELTARAAEKAEACKPTLSLGLSPTPASTPATTANAEPVAVVEQPPVQPARPTTATAVRSAAAASSGALARPSTASSGRKAASERPASAPAAPVSAGGSASVIASSGAKGKETRAKKEARSRWVHAAEGVPSHEAVEQLKEQFAALVKPELVAKLFGTDFRDHLGALVSLEVELSAAEKALNAANDPEMLLPDLPIAQAADILCRWLSLRLLTGSANTAVVLKCAAFTEKLISVLASGGYTLSELEARALIPALCSLLGSNAEATRLRFRALLRSACAVVSPALVGAQLADDCASTRNAKARVECAEELVVLAKAHGMAACAPQRSVPLAASLAAAPDKRLRGAATMLLRAARDEDALAINLEGALDSPSIRALVSKLGAPMPGSIDAAASTSAKLVNMNASNNAGTVRESGTREGIRESVRESGTVPEGVRNPQPTEAPPAIPPPTPPRPATPAAPPSRLPARVSAAAPSRLPPAAAAQGPDIAPLAPSSAAATSLAPPSANQNAGISPAIPGSSKAGVGSLAKRAGRASSHISASPLLAPSAASTPPAAAAAVAAAVPETKLAQLACALFAHGTQDEAERVGALRSLVSLMENSDAATLKAHAEPIFEAIFSCLRSALFLDRDVDASLAEDAAGSDVGCGVSARWCKHLLNALMTLIKAPGAVRALSEGCARNAVSCLLRSMIRVHAQETVIPEGARMLKALNLLVLRVLDELPRTRLAITLLGLLADFAPAAAAVTPPTPSLGLTPGGSKAAGRPDMCALILKSLDKATAALASAAGGDAPAADLEPRHVLAAVVSFLRAHHAPSDSPSLAAPVTPSSPAASPRRGGGSLGRRAREAVRSLATEVLRVGGLTVDQAVALMTATDGYLLKKCFQDASILTSPSLTGVSSITDSVTSRRTGSARRASAASLVASSTRQRSSSSEEEPPAMPLAQALVDAAAQRELDAPPSSARVTRSAAKSRTSMGVDLSQMMPTPARALELLPPASARRPRKTVVEAEEIVDAVAESPEKADSDVAVDAVAAAVLVTEAVLASGLASESVQARVERIRQLRAKYPGALPPPSSTALPAAPVVQV